MPSRLNRADYLALNTFVLVAERLSFREVAEMLDISPSAVSQQIMGLEDRLGIRLFTRTTRVVKLTDEGKSLYAQTSSLLQGLADSLAQAHARSQLIQGHLRIHAFRSAAEMLLDKKLADFLSAFPDVHLDLSINDAPTDLIAGGYDLSLRLGEVLDPGLVAVPAGGRLHQIVVAAPSYLEKRETITKPEDLVHHNCIGWRWPGTLSPVPWQFTCNGQLRNVQLTGNLVVDDRERQYQAAIMGIGIAQVTAERVEAQLASGKLTRILGQWETEFPGYYLCWTSGKAVTPAMRAFIDWISLNGPLPSAR
ncbi:hypothetical protein HA51_03670 [Pantoea rwandensis]|uniref:HTH lysR-type domain-containing protein n=1 Tax=Pantoea rwandensis TaxID=1076550 RepID=A0A1X1D695_9GAMM|nr:hypothetical protein HA51_03670 [Pantoea rwandensis]